MHPMITAVLGIAISLLAVGLFAVALERHVAARKRRERREFTARLEAAVRDWEQR